MNLLEALLQLFLRFGYVAVFLGVMAENAGIPLPGETILLAAGFFASQGHFSLGLVVLLATAGAILGDNLGYLLGEKVARPFLTRRGRFLLLTPPRLRAAEAFFERHGDKTILFARFVSGLRVVAALFAGLSGMRWRMFAIYNAAGAFRWAVAMSLLGFFFGASWHLLEKWVGVGGLLALSVGGLALLLTVMLHHTRTLRRAVAAVLPRALGRREGVILLANLTALSLFSKVIEDVVTGESSRFDRVLLHLLHVPSDSILTVLAQVGSALGSLPAVLLLVAGGTWLLAKRGARREALGLLAAAGTAEAVTLILLYTVQRTHPSLWDVLVHLNHYSFPSGHALVATATYGMAAYLTGRLWPAWERPSQVGASLLVLAIGISRVALGANWPTDVLGGFAGGLLILWALIYWYEGNYTVILDGLALLGRREAGQNPGPPGGREKTEGNGVPGGQ